MSDRKNIIVACDSFATGGAETFALRIAKYYAESGHIVYLAAIESSRINKGLVNMNAPGIKVITVTYPKIINWTIYKIDGLLSRLKIYTGIRRRNNLNFFRRFLRKHDIQVIHTNLFAAFEIFAEVCKDKPNIKLLHTVHADIIEFAYKELKGQNLFTDNAFGKFLSKNLDDLLTRANWIVCPAQMHLKIFKHWKRLNYEKIRKIYYPYTLPEQIIKVSRGELGIPENAFVYGIVSRCIKEKGWEEVIQAVLQINIPDVYLILVGDGVFLEDLKIRYGSNANIIFTGYQSDTFSFIEMFDVGISATYFWDSLPSCIIEYLGAGKPVICTDNAESYEMLKGEKGVAGVCVPLEKDEWDVVLKEQMKLTDNLKAAILKLYEDDEFRNLCVSYVPSAYKKFDPLRIVEQYEKLF